MEVEQTRVRQRGVLVWLRLVRVFQKIDVRSERLFRSHDLNTAQFDVLTHVGAASGISQQELADALLVTKGNVSQLLGRLERRGLVDRRHEGRANCLTLTSAGRRKFEAVVPLQEAQVAGLLSCLSGREQRELLRLLRKIDHSIEA